MYIYTYRYTYKYKPNIKLNHHASEYFIFEPLPFPEGIQKVIGSLGKVVSGQCFASLERQRRTILSQTGASCDTVTRVPPEVCSTANIPLLMRPSESPTPEREAYTAGGERTSLTPALNVSFKSLKKLIELLWLRWPCCTAPGKPYQCLGVSWVTCRLQFLTWKEVAPGINLAEHRMIPSITVGPC